MRIFWRNVRLGAARSIGFCLIVSVFGVTVLLAQNISTFQSGDLITAQSMNANFTTVTNKITEASPNGAIMAFYLSACPTGWTAADGSNSTPDLRGNFLRGLDDMGTGAAGVDPSGVRALGNLQTDAMQGHHHNRTPGGHHEAFIFQIAGGVHSLPNLGGHSFNGAGAGTDTGGPVTDSANGTPRTASETRPRNISLIFCMRTGS